jgi:hypothetical protein
MSETDDRQQARTRSRRLISLLGGIIFFFGLGLGLYLTLMVVNAEGIATFSFIASEMPDKPLSKLRCPPLLARHETGRVTATILNPRDKVTGYSVHIRGTIIADVGQHTGPVILSDADSPNGTITSIKTSDLWGYPQKECTATETKVIIPAGETVDLTWQLSLTDDIQGEIVGLNLYAFGQGDDRTYADALGFNAWDFSYHGTCGMAVINLLGLTGKQVAGLVLLSMLSGGIFWLYGRTPLSRLSYIGAILGGFLWLILLWRLTTGIGTGNYFEALLYPLTCFVTPVLVLALLVLLVIPLVRPRLRKPALFV